MAMEYSVTLESLMSRCNETTLGEQDYNLPVCILALVTQLIFWCQVLYFPLLRQRSMQWIYAYPITDLLLLCQYFLVYIVRARFDACSLDPIVVLGVCFVDATLDNYLNMIQSYILLGLNLCRYVQIASNRNVYEQNVRLLIASHIIMYLVPLILLILPYFVNWAYIVNVNNDSCDVRFSHLFAKVLNLMMAFFLPITLNLGVILASVYRIRHATQLKTSQHFANARQKYYRSLTIQFCIFYMIWISLWTPNIIVYQLSAVPKRVTITVRLLNYIGIALDPIIVGSLDARFRQTWKRLYSDVKNNAWLHCKLRRGRRVHPPPSILRI